MVLQFIRYYYGLMLKKVMYLKDRGYQAIKATHDRIICVLISDI